MKTHSKPICKSHERYSKQNLQIHLLSLPTLNLQTFILTVLTVFGLTTCDSSNQENIEQPTATADTIIKTITNPEINQDTFQSGKWGLSGYEKATAILLTTGIKSDTGNKIGTEKWFGLFHSDTGYYLAQTKIIVERATHPLFDESGNEKSGFSVQTLNKDESIILIAGLDFLSDHKIGKSFIQQRDFSIDPIFPEDTLKFNYLGIDYKIYATGGKKVTDKSSNYNVWDYKLYLNANKNGQVITELITQELDNEIGPDEMPTIIFAGDIDGDGFLDLLVDEGEHKIARKLYLSIIAEKGHLIKVAGTISKESC